MKPNKKLFLAVVDALENICAGNGYVSHPAYPTAWEPANQAYQASLIQSDMRRHIDQLEISFYPAERAFRFVVNRSLNDLGVLNLDDIPENAGEWTDQWLHRPFDEYLLNSGSQWNLFSRKNHFKVRKSFARDVAAEADRISNAFSKKSHHLFAALNEGTHSRLVSVTHYDLR